MRSNFHRFLEFLTLIRNGEPMKKIVHKCTRNIYRVINISEKSEIFLPIWWIVGDSGEVNLCNRVGIDGWQEGRAEVDRSQGITHNDFSTRMWHKLSDFYGFTFTDFKFSLSSSSGTELLLPMRMCLPITEWRYI